jgi:beta-lactamase regulating signal transducer with metallopeptidase domain
MDLLRSLDIVLKVSIVLGGAALVARLLSRGSAAARHQIWAVAIAASLAMPLLAAMAPQWTIAVLPAPPAVEETRTVAPAPRQVTVADADAVFEPVPTLATSAHAGSPGSQPVPARAFNQLPTMVMLWIAGALAVLGRLAFGTARVWWMARRARPADVWVPLGEELAESLGLDRRVMFLSGDRDAMPMAWGLIRARVLLPADADEWPVSRQRVVLLHELAHVKRRDCMTQLISQLACAAYWFNPLVWIAARRLRAERERACDDLVLAAGTRGSDYADHLLDIARSLRAGAWPTWSAVTMAHRSQLEGRLMAILDPALPRRSPTRRSIALCAALAIVCIVSLAGVRPVASEPEAQGRPSAPATPTPTPTPLATPSPAPSPAPSPTPSQAPTPTPLPAPRPAPRFAGSVPGALWDVDIDPVVIDRAIDAALNQTVGQAGRPEAADPRIIAALTDALKDENKDVREQALHTLMRMRAALPVETYLTLMKDEDADVRQQAVFAIGRLRDPKYFDVLLSAIKDQDEDVRQQAAFALGHLRDPRSVDALIPLLKDQTADVRQQAAFALGQIRDRRAIDPLIAALKDADSEVRQQAAFALGQIR